MSSTDSTSMQASIQGAYRGGGGVGFRVQASIQGAYRAGQDTARVGE